MSFFNLFDATFNKHVFIQPLIILDSVSDLRWPQQGREVSGQAAEEGRRHGHGQPRHRLHLHHLPFRQVDSEHLRTLTSKNEGHLPFLCFIEFFLKVLLKFFQRGSVYNNELFLTTYYVGLLLES